MTSAIDNRYQIPFGGLFYLFFVLIFASLRFTVGSGSNGNYEQWVNLTNQMFYGHQDFLFSYGPLYWISGEVLGGATSQYSVISYWTAILFVGAVYAIFWAAVVWMASEARSLLFLSAIFLLFFQDWRFRGMFLCCPFILAVYLDLHRQALSSRKEYFLYGALIALFFYIRFVYGVAALLTLGTYLASLAVVNKNLRGLAYLFFGLIVLYVIIGLFVFHDYSSIANYILINNQLSFGNSVDMTLDVVNKPQTWVAVAVCAIALSVYALLRRRRLFLTVSLLILFFLKLGFSRTDHYLSYFVGPLAVMSLLPLLDRSAFGRGTVVISALCLCYLSFSPSFPGARVKEPGVNFLVSYEDRMRDVYKDFQLPPELLKQIGDESIDIYPFNNEYAFANKLNYKYRPVFQNYMTLTPKLDAMNQAFFESSGRPQFILWAPELGCGSAECNPFDALDGKYVLNEDPLTTGAIFCNYHKVAASEGKGGVPLVLLEKNESVRGCQEASVKNEKLEFGKWYNVPVAESGLLKLRPGFEFTTYGKIKNLLFRGSILRVKYKLATDEVRQYRLNILNSQSGIVVSPLLDNFDYTGARVDKIMFETSNPRYFKPFFDVQWFTVPEPEVKTRKPFFDAVSSIPPEYTEVKNIQCEGSVDAVGGVSPSPRTVDVSGGFSVRGWLAYSTQAGELNDKTFLTITDDKGDTSFISTRKQTRSDVAAAFHKEALADAGYEALIDSSAFDGKAKLGLAALKDSVLYKCEQFEVDLNPTQ